MESNTEWKRWGKTDPLFGVASWAGKNKDGKNPWTDEEFYQLGQADWSDFLSHWEKYGLEKGRCLEIGCGAGRLTRAMIQTFKQVDALDISDAMLAYAQKNIQAENITFHLADGQNIPLPDMTLDSVFSTHVFQHFEAEIGVKQYFAEIARVLKPGGSMMIHLPVFSWPEGSGFLVKVVYKIGKFAQKFKIRIKRQLIKLGLDTQVMCMNSYEMSWLYEVLSEAGFENIEISVFATKCNNHPHSFVLASKPTTSHT